MGEGGTGYTEVAYVEYDPGCLGMEVQVGCFVAMHDPTMVKAHRDYGVGGRYMSCVFLGGSGIGGGWRGEGGGDGGETGGG